MAGDVPLSLIWGPLEDALREMVAFEHRLVSTPQEEKFIFDFWRLTPDGKGCKTCHTVTITLEDDGIWVRYCLRLVIDLEYPMKEFLLYADPSFADRMFRAVERAQREALELY